MGSACFGLAEGRRTLSVLGPVGVGWGVRLVFLVGTDPDQPDQRVFVLSVLGPRMFGRFLRIWLVLVLVLTGGMAAFNAYVDPLWVFDHANAWNTRQWGFDERQQKVNRIQFGAFDYDALLLGSSRASYISVADFYQHKVFNLAASDMRPVEFGDYIAFAETKRGRPFEVVYLGLDFFATNRLYKGSAEPANTYIQRARAPLYRLEALMSYDTFNNARRYRRDSQAAEDCDCYDFQRIKHRPIRPVAEREAALAIDLAEYRSRVYGKYSYDEDYLSVLQSLRQRFPSTRFVAFTTPESAVLYRLLRELGLEPAHRRWLQEIVDCFGQVQDFTGLNPVTKNSENYADGHHFYPVVGKLIAESLEGHTIAASDFGRLVLLQRKSTER